MPTRSFNVLRTLLASSFITLQATATIVLGPLPIAVECLPALFAWQGESPPFTVLFNSTLGSQTFETPLPHVAWIPIWPAGTNVTIHVSDTTQDSPIVLPFVVRSDSNSTCQQIFSLFHVYPTSTISVPTSTAAHEPTTSASFVANVQASPSVSPPLSPSTIASPTWMNGPLHSSENQSSSAPPTDDTSPVSTSVDSARAGSQTSIPDDTATPPPVSSPTPESASQLQPVSSTSDQGGPNVPVYTAGTVSSPPPATSANISAGSTQPHLNPATSAEISDATSPMSPGPSPGNHMTESTPRTYSAASYGSGWSNTAVIMAAPTNASPVRDDYEESDVKLRLLHDVYYPHRNDSRDPSLASASGFSVDGGVRLGGGRPSSAVTPPWSYVPNEPTSSLPPRYHSTLDSSV
ncbi:uncharacterized protein BXZ73DRAFT_77038 [Epithele typhae]|uniref:uncharacterized protein n=1 Tax=Epithele typhae TaxID=378194 RepID=UPI002007D012|nr:uncharacterized protein BXZ73DRAFT_77038 [Epithele typhae]KAH9934567.1 hypothetical protein BXZ73DRAFT_77038 [Epithele typhae]